MIVIVLSASEGDAFEAETIALVAASVVLELLAVTAKSVGRFRLFHWLRFATILAVARIISSDSPVVDLCLLLPFVIEIALYEDRLPAIVETSLVVTLFALIRFVPSSGFDPNSRDAMLTVVISSSFCGTLSIFAIAIRERAVNLSKQVDSLNATIANLSEANRSFQVYADTMESRAADRERSTITRELHDTVGYALTNVIVMMNAAKVVADRDPAWLSDLFDRVRDQSEVALAETRSILYRLREVPERGPTGLEAVHHLARSFEGATGIAVELHPGNAPASLGTRIDGVIFRVVQEGLTNAFRHGAATNIYIQFWLAEEEFRLSIQDNGSGVGARGEIVEGIGLAGMRERLSDFGGTVDASSEPGGFTLRVAIPYTRSTR